MCAVLRRIPTLKTAPLCCRHTHQSSITAVYNGGFSKECEEIPLAWEVISLAWEVIPLAWEVGLVVVVAVAGLP